MSKCQIVGNLMQWLINVFVSFSADCNCGFVCAERDRSSKVMSPCSSGERPCRCHKGMLLILGSLLKGNIHHIINEL